MFSRLDMKSRSFIANQALQVIHSLDTLDQTSTEIPIKNLKKFMCSRNQHNLIKAFKRREYVKYARSWQEFQEILHWDYK